MRTRFWRRKNQRRARVEFRDGRPARVLCGLVTLTHDQGFITLRTKYELFHWHQDQVRMVHVFSAADAPAIKKEAAF